MTPARDVEGIIGRSKDKKFRKVGSHATKGMVRESAMAEYGGKGYWSGPA